MWKASIILQAISPADDYSLQPMFYTYALGWDVQDYRGAKNSLARWRSFRLSGRGRADSGEECRLLD